MTIRAYLIDQCDVIMPSVTTKYNEVTMADTTIDCKIIWKSKYIKDFRGEDILSIAQVIMESTVNISQEGRIRIDSNQYQIVNISKPKDLTANHFIRVYL